MTRKYSLYNWLPILLAVLFLTIAGCQPTGAYHIVNSNNDLLIKDIVSDNEVKSYTKNQVSCTTSNPNGDNLTYYWSATGGVIKGQGEMLIWIAPETSGIYTIEVAVSNGTRVSPAKSKNIHVLADPTNSNKPLTIKKVIVLPPNGNPITFSPLYDDDENQPKVAARIWQTMEIECVADDQTDHMLTYIWESTGGKITNNGNKVDLTMPGVAGDYSVFLTINCNKGDTAAYAMQFTTNCCGK